MNAIYNKVFFTILLFCVSGFSFVSAQPLSGSYTINGAVATGGTNYQTFSDAVSDLEANGISDNVVFNVASGTYNEQITITKIAGTSTSDTIIFQSASGDSTDVVLTFSASSSDNYTVELDSAEYITFQKMTLAATNTSFGHVVQFTNHVVGINLLNNYIVGTDATTSTNQALIFSNNNVSGQAVKILNNYLDEGSHGLYLDMNNSGNFTGMQISSNNIFNSFSRGMYIQDADFLTVSDNRITSDDEYTGFEGIHLFDCDSSLMVLGNYVYGVKNRALLVQHSTNSSANRGLIANNFLHSRDNGDGVFMTSNDYLDIFHNSIHKSNNTNVNNYALQMSHGDFNRIWNNIFANSGGGPAVY
ncbi:MAG: hypothetical protein WD077_02100, partial [Bacteroidia bacterium]